MRTTSRMGSCLRAAEVGPLWPCLGYCVTVPKGGQRMDAQTVPDLLRHSIETHRKADAFLVKRQGRWQPVSIFEFEVRVRAVAAELVRRGVKRGDRVVILSENRLEWAIADQAILSIAAVSVPVYATLPADHVAPLVADSGAVGAFVSNAAQEEKVRSGIRQAPSLQWVMCFDDGLPGGAVGSGTPAPAVRTDVSAVRGPDPDDQIGR